MDTGKPLLGKNVVPSDNKQEPINYKERVEKAKKQLRNRIYILVAISFVLSAIMFGVFFVLMK